MRLTSRLIISISLCFQWKAFVNAISAPRVPIGISSNDPSRRRSNSLYVKSRGGAVACTVKPTKTMPGAQMQILK